MYIVKASAPKSSILLSPVHRRQHQAEKVAEHLPYPEKRRKETRDIALKRDDRRCAVSRRMLKDDWTKAGMPVGEAGTFLEVAHIIPFSYGSYKDEEVSACIKFWSEVLER